MNVQDYSKLYNRALFYWGKNAQIDLNIEEMAELTKAHIKYRRDPTEGNRKLVEEEIADVQHTLDQMKIIYSNPIDFSAWMVYKAMKLEKKLIDHAGDPS